MNDQLAVSTPTPLLSLMLVDDEADVINALKRVFRKEYNIVSYTSANEALTYLKTHEIDIILSDMRMPEIDGADFLSQAKEIQPSSMRLILSGYSDMDATLKAINQASIFSFLTKPWDNEEIKLNLARAADYYLLEKKNRILQEELAEKNDILNDLNDELGLKFEESTDSHQASVLELHKKVIEQRQLYKDLVEMLSAIISYRTGSGSSHIERIAHQCRLVAIALKLEKSKCNQIYVSALVHELGMLGLSDSVFTHKNINELVHNQDFLQHPKIGAEILGKIQRLANLSENVLHQNENYDGSGTPEHLSAEDIPIGARILRVVRDFDYMVSGNQNPEKISPHSAKSWLNDKLGIIYDKEIVDAFFEVLKQRPADKSYDGNYCVGVEELKENDELKQDFILANGNTMLTKGQIINQTIIDKLKEYEQKNSCKIALFIK